MTRSADRAEPSGRRLASHRSRGRGGRGRASAQATSRDAPLSGKPQNRSRKAAARRHSKPTSRGTLPTLPDDIVAQSLLPFLVWHDTSALASVNKSWSHSVRLAKRRSAEWKTTTHGGDNPHDCLVDMIARLGLGGVDALRFAPVLALVSLSFANHHDARQAEAVWKELVHTVVSHDILPVGCVLVGLLNGAISGENGLPVPRESERTVNFTVSIGHFGETAVDSEAFDRKVLRWSASGLTEEIACPFVDVEGKANERTSLLIWSNNTKPARALLQLAAQWFPKANVGGAVLSQADHAPSLMTFTRALSPRRVNMQASRRTRTTKVSPAGLFSCPAALMIRLRGRVFVKPLELCLDRPLTPILRNEALTMPEGVDFIRRDSRVYRSVSIVDFSGGNSMSQSLDTIVGDQMQRGNSPGGIMNLYSSRSAFAIRVAMLPELNVHYDTNYRHSMEEVRSISLFVDQHGLLTIDDHWEVGDFGVVTVRCSAEDLGAVITNRIRQLGDSVKEISDTILGTVVVCSTEIDDDSIPVILAAFRGCVGAASIHECFAASEVGPIIMPGSRGNNPYQLQTGTVGGFILCRSGDFNIVLG